MLYPIHQAGFASIIGKPNVGKSTFMNALVGEKLSIISPKAQTTRHNILGMLNAEHYQVIFNDTPGVLTPAYNLQEFMMKVVYDSLLATDIVLLMIDIHDKDLPPIIQKNVLNRNIPTFLLINKIDLVTTEQLTSILSYWQKKLPVEDIIPLAAVHTFDPSVIINRILPYLPEHPPYYAKDMLTDRSERFFAAEIIREQLLHNYRKEIPYSVEVTIENFKVSDTLVQIGAVIYVEKKSQKAILIGHRGGALKKVGIAARAGLEKFLAKKVFLTQHIKVLPDWRHKTKLLQRFGYA